MERKILIVDDTSSSELLAPYLRNIGFQVSLAKDGGTGLTKALTESPALVVLETELPGISGYEVCRQLKSVVATRHIPILMLSARNADQDRIRGLEVGAEDYIGKPFNVRELLLRIQRSLGRSKPAESIAREKLVVGDFVLDPVRHELHLRRKQVDLTAVEFKILALLMKHRGAVLERETLLHQVWGYESSIYVRTIDTHVQRIRGKLGEQASSIETVRGVGYRIRDEPGLAGVIEQEEPCLAAA